MKRKFFALIMAAVLCLGMSTTAFAATNDSPAAPNESPEIDSSTIFAEQVYSNVEIAAGGGYLEKITDMDMQKIIVDRIIGEFSRLAEYTYTYIYTATNPFTGEEEAHSLTENLMPAYFFAFDVQGVKSGQVTVHLNDQGNFKVSNFINRLVAVSHYNTKTGEWEVMDDFAVIDKNGNVTFAFDSYSPVLLSVLYTHKDEVANDENYTIMETTYHPTQTLLPTADGGNGANGGSGTDTASKQAIAPKTGDSNLGWMVLLVGAAAVCGAFRTRKKEA